MKAELAAELRALRKQHMKPVSRMGVRDISQEIEHLKTRLAETPTMAALPSAPHKAEVAAVESVKAAKAAEFPVRPAWLKDEKRPVGRPRKAPAAEHKEEHPTKKVGRPRKAPAAEHKEEHPTKKVGRPKKEADPVSEKKKMALHLMKMLDLECD